jgi:hypothetical protein
MSELQYLELWRVSGLTDLDVLAELRELEYLRLEQLKQVVTLPSFRKLARLRRVVLEDMKGIHDLSPIADAPNLEELLVVQMPHLATNCLEPFAGHPRLRHALAGLGSTRRNEAALAFVPGVASGGLSPFRFTQT